MNNANIDKIKKMARENGIKIKYICSQLGLAETYLSNCKSGKDRMTDERLYKIADILGTTYEYLTDQTDDPSPKTADIIASADSADEKVVLMLISKLPELSEDDIDILEALLSLPKQEFSHCLNVLKVVMKQ